MVKKIKVALVGIGNCFSGLIQGIEYYKQNPSQEVTGIIHDKLAGYGIHDIDFVCGFDVAENKYIPPNQAIPLLKHSFKSRVFQIFSKAGGTPW